MKKQKQWDSKVMDSNQKPSFLELGKELLNQSKLGNAVEVLDLISRGAPFATDWTRFGRWDHPEMRLERINPPRFDRLSSLKKINLAVGTSPLHWAAFYNHIEVAETLLMASICRDARNKVNRTPLHVAAQKGHHKIIQVLLDYGADVNCKDILKMTPLHWAAESGSKESVQLLLDYGAETPHINVFDKSAAMIAKDNNNYEILKLIEEISAMDPSVRAVSLRILRQKNKEQVVAKAAIELPTSQNFSAVRLKVVPKPQKIGILVDKTNPVTGEKMLQLIKNDSLSSNNNFSPHISSENLDVRPNSIKVISDAKLPIPNSKLSTVPESKFGDTNSNTSPKTGACGSKKIITIKADQLINMTKEKKVIITDSRPISNARFFEGKLYTEDQKDELAQKVNIRLQEAKRRAEHLINQLKKVNEEIDGYNKLLGSLHKRWPVH